MKREILCPECHKRLIHDIAESNCLEEHVNYEHGTTKQNLICDHCGRSLLEGDECIAISIWSDWQENPYYEWEDEYLSI